MSRFLGQLRGQIIGLVALGVALSGTAYAALSLPPNSVGTGVVKNNSLTGKDVKNGSLTKVDLKRGTLLRGPKGETGAKGDKGTTGATGPRGAKGDKGDNGAPGSARAWGTIGSDGALVGPSLNIAASSRIATGEYCFRTSIGLSPANAVALADTDSTPTGTAAGESAQIVSGGTGCPAGSWGVRTYTAIGAADDAAFAVMVP
jgi:Collagen triple helix repeat (20 copies)